ncbi:hypothetical protein LSM04_007414 [Trypanosoma melophagium]|uniref:uncharacterized protein n=1 Tax=Trypanosoma melophagium TaxID=715481 RepID=UPI00351A6524|nr:hypothetical protein LSM04_007414 [Trypanosoma melophagium]
MGILGEYVSYCLAAVALKKAQKGQGDPRPQPESPSENSDETALRHASLECGTFSPKPSKNGRGLCNFSMSKLNLLVMVKMCSRRLLYHILFDMAKGPLALKGFGADLVGHRLDSRKKTKCHQWLL